MRGVMVCVGASMLLGVAAGSAEESSPSAFDGERALADVERLVDFGPRSVGSEGHRKALSFLERELRASGVEVHRDEFVAQTPLGPRTMTNLIATPAVQKTVDSPIVIVAGHYDTKRFDDRVFLGANDGGSSAGVLLELSRGLGRLEPPLAVAVWLVLLDGEEAMLRWSPRDSLYGSRHLATQMVDEGLVDRLRAFVLLDMVGDRDLGILKESLSTDWLQELVWEEARRLGHGDHFLDEGYPVDDDHVPFLRLGVPAVDLIDLDYGPENSYWHTSEDTLDKLSATSLQVVGETVLATLARLDERFGK